eukprot:TRINITY_DN8036_c0_g1_i21.p1 TRINITY_DN8036_c0_g1~~TRINITY_DN8036_c0_g1_i21.p1  ORF type:complete len:268 (+),score=25.56 TRINITY_DN8036_c0_g1_i21:147-950(+)
MDRLRSTSDPEPRVATVEELDKLSLPSQQADIIVVGLTEKGHLRSMTAGRLGGDMSPDEAGGTAMDSPDPEGDTPRQQSPFSTPIQPTHTIGSPISTVAISSSPTSGHRRLGGQDDDEDGLVVMREDENKTRFPDDEPRDGAQDDARDEPRESGLKVEIPQETQMLKYADVTFDDVVDEVKQLVGNDWPRFKKSKHWKELVREVAARSNLAPLMHHKSEPGQPSSPIARPSRLASASDVSASGFGRSNTLSDPSASGFGSVSKEEFA